MFDHDLLEDRMEEKGLSDAGLATKVGVDRKTIYRIRKGLEEPRFGIAARIAKFLDLRLSAFDASPAETLPWKEHTALEPWPVEEIIANFSQESTVIQAKYSTEGYLNPCTVADFLLTEAHQAVGDSPEQLQEVKKRVEGIASFDRDIRKNSDYVLRVIVPEQLFRQLFLKHPESVDSVADVLRQWKSTTVLGLATTCQWQDLDHLISGTLRNLHIPSDWYKVSVAGNNAEICFRRGQSFVLRSRPQVQALRTALLTGSSVVAGFTPEFGLSTIERAHSLTLKRLDELAWAAKHRQESGRPDEVRAAEQNEQRFWRKLAFRPDFDWEGAGRHEV